MINVNWGSNLRWVREMYCLNAMVAVAIMFSCSLIQLPAQDLPITKQETIKEDKSEGVMIGIGSVVDVISGNPELAKQPIPLKPFSAGFQAGSPIGLDSIGEFIAINGIGYTRSTGNSNRGKLIWANRYFLMVLYSCQPKPNRWLHKMLRP